MSAMIGKIISRFITVAVALIATLWLIAIGFAQATCSIFLWFGTQCHDPRLDVWMLPFAGAPIGIPALIGSVIAFLKIRKRHDRSAVAAREELSGS